jgi:hypothetical protein
MQDVFHVKIIRLLTANTVASTQVALLVNLLISEENANLVMTIKEPSMTLQDVKDQDAQIEEKL